MFGGTICRTEGTTTRLSINHMEEAEEEEEEERKEQVEVVLYPARLERSKRQTTCRGISLVEQWVDR